MCGMHASQSVLDGFQSTVVWALCASDERHGGATSQRPRVCSAPYQSHANVLCPLGVRSDVRCIGEPVGICLNLL